MVSLSSEVSQYLMCLDLLELLYHGNVAAFLSACSHDQRRFCSGLALCLLRSAHPILRDAAAAKTKLTENHQFKEGLEMASLLARDPNKCRHRNPGGWLCLPVLKMAVSSRNIPLGLFPHLPFLTYLLTHPLTYLSDPLLASKNLFLVPTPDIYICITGLPWHMDTPRD